MQQPTTEEMLQAAADDDAMLLRPASAALVQKLEDELARAEPEPGEGDMIMMSAHLVDDDTHARTSAARCDTVLLFAIQCCARWPWTRVAREPAAS